MTETSNNSMNKTRLLLYLLILLLPSCATLGGKVGEDFFLDVKYRSCYDGDTCRFDISGVHPLIGDNMPVRLRGIDTPEIKGKCDAEKRKAIEARNLLRNLLKEAQKIDLVEVSKGKYFRFVALIEADGVDTSKVILDTKLGVPYDGEKKTHDWCGEKE